MLQPRYPLQTKRLLLRPFTLEDLDDVYAYHRLPEVVRYLYWEVKTREETRQELSRRLSQTKLEKEGDPLVLAVELPQEKRVIGDVFLFWRSVTHRQGEIGFAFNPAYSGRGYATEAARLMLNLGFEDLALHRIFGRCDGRNTASANLMRRLGMRQEAHFRQNELFKGEWGDELQFALLRSEWEIAKHQPN